MAKPLEIPENQMRAILRAARKEGVRVEVRVGNIVVTVLGDEEEKPVAPIANKGEFRL